MTAVLPAGPARPHPARTPDQRPSHRPAHRPGRHLRPVERPGSRRSPAVPALVAVGIVIAALLALAVMHALLIGGQVRLDGLRRDVAAETEAIRRLELRVAELESPGRVLDVARDRLGMVQPAEVGYLLPVGVDGGPEEPVRVDPAELPPPPESVVEESAEQAEVDRAVADEQAGTDPERAADAADTADTAAGADGAPDVEAAADQPAGGGRDE